MTETVRQRLLVREGELVVERRADRSIPTDDGWIALVRAREGLTVIRPVAEGEAPAQVWRAFYGDSAHGLDLPGMLLAIIGPLSGAGLPVFVASTFDADLVLVPSDQIERAIELLSAAGHQVVR